jgi:hypothetical protein
LHERTDWRLNRRTKSETPAYSSRFRLRARWIATLSGHHSPCGTSVTAIFGHEGKWFSSVIASVAKQSIKTLWIASLRSQ